MDLWTAKLPTTPHLPPPLPTGGRPPGLTRFACPTFLKIFPFGVEQGVAAERGQRKRCPPPLRPPAPCLIDPMGARVPKGTQGAKPKGSGGSMPPAEERPRRGLEAGGSSRPKAATALARPPLWGV